MICWWLPRLGRKVGPAEEEGKHLWFVSSVILFHPYSFRLKYWWFISKGAQLFCCCLLHHKKKKCYGSLRIILENNCHCCCSFLPAVCCWPAYNGWARLLSWNSRASGRKQTRAEGRPSNLAGSSNSIKRPRIYDDILSGFSLHPVVGVGGG